MDEKSLVEAVAEAVDDLDLATKDRGTAALALAYAATIEARGELDRMGLQLLAVFDALLMTPRARAIVNKGVTSVSPSDNPVDEIKARRAKRLRDAQAVDAPAT